MNEILKQVQDDRQSSLPGLLFLREGYLYSTKALKTTHKKLYITVMTIIGHAELVSASNLTLGAFHYNKENEILKRVQDDRREFLP